MATKYKNVWILILFILSGLVIGGLLGELASKIDFLWWLGYGESFGLTNPLEIKKAAANIEMLDNEKKPKALAPIQNEDEVDAVKLGQNRFRQSTRNC